MCGRSLSSLPLVVQDEVLENLDRASLASVSLTCRSLHREAQKYLYRDLGYFRDHHGLIERNIRCQPSLIPYIRSFYSFNPSFLEWMWVSASPSLESLHLRWDESIEPNVYEEFLESILPRGRVKRLEFGPKPAFKASMLSSLKLLTGLTVLKLTKTGYPLQTILESLQAPSLEILEVRRIVDWRLEWRKSFEDAIPNLCGLRLGLDWSEAEEFEAEKDRPPNDVKWETVMMLYQRSIYFDIYNSWNLDKPFLGYAPSYARAHGLNPVALVQWQIKSLELIYAKDGLAYFSVFIAKIPFDELSTILRSVKSMDIWRSGMQLSLDLPLETTASIADILPDNIFKLSIKPPPGGFLDPSVVPACIRSLPNLECLAVYLNASGSDLKILNGCTAATCSFQSLPIGLEIVSTIMKVSRKGAPVWEISLYDRRIGRGTDTHDPGNQVSDFEREITGWLGLSTSIKLVSIYFAPFGRGTY